MPVVFNKLDISEEIFWPIHKISQDQKGLMWFSGRDNLLYYDGKRTDTITFENFHPGLSITGVFNSPDNKLVVATTKGLFIVNNDLKTKSIPEPALKGSINEMLVENGDSLWLGTNQGLIHYSITGGLIKTLTIADGLPSDVVHGLLLDKDSKLWISTWEGIAILPSGAKSPIRIEHYNNNGLFGQMAQDANGKIWAGGETELSAFDLELNKVDSINSDINSLSLPPTYIPWQILLSDKTGHIWHATPNNLSIYNPLLGKHRDVKLNIDFRIEQLTDLFEDKDGSIWLTTTMGNIFRYDLNLFSFTTLPIPNCPYQSASIHGIVPLYEDYLAVGTDKGLYFSKSDFSQHRLIIKDKITALDIDSSKRIWLTTEKEVLQLEVDEESLQVNELKRAKLADASVSQLLIHQSDCWIGTFDHGVFRMRMEEGVLSRYTHHPGDLSTLSSNHIASMLIRDDRLWLGTVEGDINKINLLSSQVEMQGTGPGPDPKNQGIINQMIPYKNNILIATGSGIKIIQENEIKKIELLEGVLADQIIFETGEFLWINSRESLDAYDIAHDRMYRVADFPAEDHQSFLFQNSNKNIYIFLDSEIRQYSHSLPTIKKTKTIISECKISGNFHPLYPGQELRQNENDIQISLSVLSYRNSEQNKYALYLEGMDGDWQENSSGFYSYSDLKPGKYNLKYKGANFSGIWGPVEEVSFTIQPFPWFTKWAISGYILSVLVISFIIVLMRKRNLSLTRDVQEKIAELEDVKLQFQHDLLNTLTKNKIEDKSIHSEDTLMLQRIIDFIDSHLGDDQFSVETIARELSMSRTKLFRQLKEYTGVSPSEFINGYRLRLAAEMLKHKSGNISEVAFSVGYKNPAHFSISFRKYHGCSPTEFVKTHTCNQ